MADKAALLQQLSIPDTAAPQAADGKSALAWWRPLAVILLATAAGGAYFAFAGPATTTVSTVSARAASVQPAHAAGILLQAAGYVIPLREATISAKVTGRVSHVFFEEGESVKEGQILASLDDTNVRASLAQASANQAVAQVAVNDARPRFDRYSKLRALNAISVDAYETAHTQADAADANFALSKAAVTVARRNLEDLTIRAPFSGIVTAKAAQQGEMVSPISAGGGFTRTGICTIVDMQSLVIDVDVGEDNINRIAIGQPVVAHLVAYPDLALPAHVIAIVPTADQTKGTIKVRARFETLDSRILPQMGVRISILQKGTAATAAPADSSVLIPASAIADTEAGPAVFVVHDDTLEQRAVKIGGLRAGNRIVTSGLVAGEDVVAADVNRLSNGQKVKLFRR